MSSTANVKETRSVGKTHKKAQRNKKQQQQQQQQQQPLLSKIADGAEIKNGKCKNMKTTSVSLNNNNNNLIKNNNTNNNNNNNIINNNKNNSNITQKLRDHLEAERKKNAAEMTLESNGEAGTPIKFERAHSFSLKGRLSKLFNSMTGSKENVSRLSTQEQDSTSDLPYQFSRSRSMILLRRPIRRSFIEPQLGQLSEEVEKTSDSAKTTSPCEEVTDGPQTPSHVEAQNPETPLETPKGIISTGTLRQNSVPMLETEDTWLGRRGSTLSLAVASDSRPTDNPQLNFQRRRSNTLIASFRSTLAGLMGGSDTEPQVQRKKKDKLNPKWSASLQSLQAIDNMVSYENMSFIDYDKLNGYEKQLEKQLSVLNLCAPPTPSPAPAPAASSIIQLPVVDKLASNGQKSHSNSVSLHGSNHSFNSANKTPSINQPTSSGDTSSAVVVRRRHKSLSHQSVKEISNSFSLDTDYEHNLDKLRNVYRDSLDSRKLEFLNDFMRNPYAPADEHIVDVLNLEVNRRPIKRRASICSATLSTGEDRTDGHTLQVSQNDN